MTPSIAKKGRGRPPKKDYKEAEEVEEEAVVEETLTNAEETPVKVVKGRGRSAKAGKKAKIVVEEDDNEEEANDDAPPKAKAAKRGKPKSLSKKDESSEEADEESHDEENEDEDKPPPAEDVDEDDIEEVIEEESPKVAAKKRGRPKATPKKKETADPLDDEEEEEEDKAPPAKIARKSKPATTYKDDSEPESYANSEDDFEVEADEADSGDDFDPKSAYKKKKKTPVKKTGKGRGRPTKSAQKKKAGRPAGPGVPKKKASSPIYYEFDLSDTSASDMDDGAKSDADDDWNYRPYGDIKVKKQRKVSKEYNSEDDVDNWKPGKPFAGERKKTKAKKVLAAGETPKRKGRPPKDGKGSGRPIKGEAKKEEEDTNEKEGEGDEKAVDEDGKDESDIDGEEE